MPRNLSPTFLAQLDSTGASAPVLFVVLEFENTTLYLFGGVGTITPAGPAYSALSGFPYGQAFTGMGWMGKVSSIPGTTKVQAQGITLSLSGIPSALVMEAVAQVRITGTATIYLAFLDSSGNVIPDPIQLFAGALDVPTLEDSGATSTISITAENPLLTLNEAPGRQFDDMDQQIYYPGDLGLSFVDALGNVALFWPAPSDYGSVWPVDFVLTPNGADIAVGGNVTIQAQLNYSDGSSYQLPSGIGSGSAWLGTIASNNPKVATAAGTGVVTGISPGICLITVTSVYPGGSGGGGGTPPPQGNRRVACSVIVHN
jgi:hypothetical protein